MKKIIFFCSVFIFFVSCSRIQELSIEEIEALKTDQFKVLELLTVSKPWKGEAFVEGKVGGTWKTAITDEPKSFNLIIAERDSSSMGILDFLYDSLVDYDYVAKKWKGRLAEPRIEINQEQNTLSVYFTLRDDLYWTYYNSSEKVKVTSDDVVFWYNEIDGDERLQNSGYNSQFIELETGELAHIDIEKINDRVFVFRYPRIIANPILHSNMSFGPKFIYEKAKKENGIEGLKSICSIDMDPKELPSIGKCYLVEYSPAQRLVYKRNPFFWDKDVNGVSRIYPEEYIVNIVSDKNTSYLLFKEGNLESYIPRPEELTEVINSAENKYTVFSAAGSLGASFLSFNQNPKNQTKNFYKWFTKTEFRQAMSCLLNRERIIQQVYRGLAEVKDDFFAEPNPYYNKEIKQKYLFNIEKAVSLLNQCGMIKKDDGILYDNDGNKVEFDLTIGSSDNITQDIATIFTDECMKVGIKVRIRTIDFQKLIEQLTSTYDWQAVIIALGVNYWPTQGSNVWPSTGNLHLWYPLQEKPATDWEAKIDQLYAAGSCEVDEKKAFDIWNEYQTILLDQCPIIYLVRPQSFYALSNKWNLENMYFDNMGGAQTEHLFQKFE